MLMISSICSQIDKAYELYLENGKSPANDIRFIVSHTSLIKMHITSIAHWMDYVYAGLVTSSIYYFSQVSIPRFKGARGIYLREPFQLQRPNRLSVSVDARFHEDAGI